MLLNTGFIDSSIMKLDYVHHLLFVFFTFCPPCFVLVPFSWFLLDYLKFFMIPFKITRWIFNNTLKKVDIPPSTIAHWLFFVLKYRRKKINFWIWKLNLNFESRSYFWIFWNWTGQNSLNLNCSWKYWVPGTQWIYKNRMSPQNKFKG